MGRSNITLKLLIGTASFAYADIAAAQVAPADLWGLDDLAEEGIAIAQIEPTGLAYLASDAQVQVADSAPDGHEHQGYQIANLSSPAVASHDLWGLQHIDVPTIDLERRFAQAEQAVRPIRDDTSAVASMAAATSEPPANPTDAATMASPRGLHGSGRAIAALSEGSEGALQSRSKEHSRRLDGNLSQSAVLASAQAFKEGSGQALAPTAKAKESPLDAERQDHQRSMADLLRRPPVELASLADTLMVRDRLLKVETDEVASNGIKADSLLQVYASNLAASEDRPVMSVAGRTSRQEPDSLPEDVDADRADARLKIRVASDVTSIFASARASRFESGDRRSSAPKRSSQAIPEPLGDDTPSPAPDRPLPFLMSDELRLRSRKEMFA